MALKRWTNIDKRWDKKIPFQIVARRNFLPKFRENFHSRLVGKGSRQACVTWSCPRVSSSLRDPSREMSVKENKVELQNYTSDSKSSHVGPYAAHACVVTSRVALWPHDLLWSLFVLGSSSKHEPNWTTDQRRSRRGNCSIWVCVNNLKSNEIGIRFLLERLLLLQLDLRTRNAKGRRRIDATCINGVRQIITGHAAWLR
jgi:hypothetical protein